MSDRTFRDFPPEDHRGEQRDGHASREIKDGFGSSDSPKEKLKDDQSHKEDSARSGLGPSPDFSGRDRSLDKHEQNQKEIHESAHEKGVEIPKPVNDKDKKQTDASPKPQSQKQESTTQKGTTTLPDLLPQGTPPPFVPTEEGKVELGYGLPALPPKPAAPQRQPGISTTQKAPNVNQQVAKPQLNLPSGSDLGIVGKIGAYQMSQTKPTSSANDIYANVYFWVYALTLFSTFFIMKKYK